MTSVEWLFKQLWETQKDKLNWFAILEKAEEMHKKEIVDSYNQDLYGGLEGNKKFNDGEEYYNEVFKSEGVK